MWPFTPKTLYDRYSKLMKLIMSIDSHFELTENEDDSVRLHLPNYKSNQPMDFHIYLMEPFLFISFVTEVEGEKISVVNSYPQDMDQQDMFNAAMASNLEKIHEIIEKKYKDDEELLDVITNKDADAFFKKSPHEGITLANYNVIPKESPEEAARRGENARKELERLKALQSQKEDEEKQTKQGNLRIVNSWSLLAFAKEHGKMQVGEFANKDTGEVFKACIFTKPDGTRTFVAFAAKMGELPPKQIAEMKDELQVVQLESGNYSLCKRATDNHKDINLKESKPYSIGTVVKTKDFIRGREIKVQSPKGSFGIMDVRIDESSWKVKRSYHNIIEGQNYIIGDVRTIEYDKEKDLLIVIFNYVLKEGYDAIWFNRQYSKICVTFYNQGKFVRCFDSEYDKAYTSLENLFAAFCAIADFKGNSAIVTLSGEAYQVEFVQNYYDESMIHYYNQLSAEGTLADEYGAEYSADRKRLIHVPGEIKDYYVLEGTEEIGNYAFDNTEAENIEYDEVVKNGNTIWDYIRSTSELVSITIPNSIRSIGKDIFVGCDKLTAIHIPEGSKEKFEQLLPEYKDLLIESISTCHPIDASEDSWTDEYGVIYSKDNKYLLSGNRLKEYDIRQGTQIICDHAFEARFDSACLEKIGIPDTVRAIGYSAFFNCAFDDIYLPDSIEYIGVNAFENCFCLRKAVLPNSIKEIDNEAFRDCSNLKSVYLPSSLRIIGQNVFSGCNSLQNIYVVKGSKARFEKLLPELANKITELDVEVDKSFREMFKTLEKEGITMLFSRNDNEDHTTFNVTIRKSKSTKTTDSQSGALLQEEEYYLKHYSQTKEEYFNCNYNEVRDLTATCKRNSSNFYRREEYPELEVGKTYEVSYIGVLRSSSWIILKEFGDKEYNAACFEIFENGESIDRSYTQEKRFWAPYLREWLKKRK